MLTAIKQNFRFGSWLLWVALLISFPWVVFGFIEWLFPRGGWPGVYSSISGLISLSILVISWFRGERQVVFMFGIFLVSVVAIALPLARVSGTRHNKPDAENPARASRLIIGRHWRGVSDPLRSVKVRNE